MRVEDLPPRRAGWNIRLHEKGGKHHLMPCHYTLAEALHAFINAAGIAEDCKGFLFRTSGGTTGMRYPINPWTSPPPGAWIRRGPRPPASTRRSAITRFGPPELPPTSRTARSSTRRKWPPTRAHAQPSSTIEQRSGSRRKRSGESDCRSLRKNFRLANSPKNFSQTFRKTGGRGHTESNGPLHVGHLFWLLPKVN